MLGYLSRDTWFTALLVLTFGLTVHAARDAGMATAVMSCPQGSSMVWAAVTESLATATENSVGGGPADVQELGSQWLETMFVTTIPTLPLGAGRIAPLESRWTRR